MLFICVCRCLTETLKWIPILGILNVHKELFPAQGNEFKVILRDLCKHRASHILRDLNTHTNWHLRERVAIVWSYFFVWPHEQSFAALLVMQFQGAGWSQFHLILAPLKKEIAKRGHSTPRRKKGLPTQGYRGLYRLHWISAHSRVCNSFPLFFSRSLFRFGGNHCIFGANLSLQLERDPSTPKATVHWPRVETSFEDGLGSLMALSFF